MTHPIRYLLLAAASLFAAASASGSVITFDEFATGTPITDQYASEGVLFSGDNPFLTDDGSNPTSPVLAGSPRFFGRITGRFVDPADSRRATVVESFTLDAGFFDSVGSVRIEWFDKDGKKLGQRSNNGTGIEDFEISESGGIASFSIGIFSDEPAGYAIDNLDITPLGPSLIFREGLDFPNGFWFLLGDGVPGVDHVGMHLDNEVYESHPPYTAPGTVQTYVSRFGTESREVRAINGVQAEHSRATFMHDGTRRFFSRVIQIEEVPIPRTLATGMRTFIENQFGATFCYLGDGTGSISSLLTAMDPANQKGGNGQFTCVGLLEAAAEAAGHRGGEGFVPNRHEKFTTDSGRVVPLLSPELMLHCARFQNVVSGVQTGANNVKQWLQGLFDPVDFLVTDPAGRRIGFVPGVGGVINEIPGAFYSGNGLYEQLLISNPLPGEYRVELRGRGKPVLAGLATADGATTMEMPLLRRNEPAALALAAAAKSGTRGDVNNDSVVNATDLSLLQLAARQFTNDPNDRRDLTGDGIISRSDVLALDRLLNPPGVGAAPFDGVVTNLSGRFVGRVGRGRPVKGRDSLSITFGATEWAATDALGNVVGGAWEPRNRTGTLVRLEFDDNAAVIALAEGIARQALRTGEVNVVLTAPPMITMVRMSNGRYKASLKAAFTAQNSSGGPIRRGRLVSKLTL